MKFIGPGLLFAGSAVGISHLVQSTRAGASYGFALAVFVVLSMLAKYPAFRFGPAYAAATGRSILSGYRRPRRYPLIFFGAYTLLTMFIATAANLLVTTGLVQAALGLQGGALTVAALLCATGMALLIKGHYHWLDIANRILFAFLTVATLAATLIALPTMNWSAVNTLFPDRYDLPTVLFIAALVGWMPTPLDVSIWHSQWAVAKIRDSGYTPSGREQRMDFNIGYVSTLVFALCFILMGAAVMHGTGVEFQDSPVTFASQVIDLYRQSLGQWSGIAVSVAAIAVMFSTTLTILDGFPRSLANFNLLFHGDEEVVQRDGATERLLHRYYWSYMFAIVAGALLILNSVPAQFTRFVDFAATISFLGAPVFACFNHRAIFGDEVPVAQRPGRVLFWWSIAGIATLTGFALLYIGLVLES